MVLATEGMMVWSLLMKVDGSESARTDEATPVVDLKDMEVHR